MVTKKFGSEKIIIRKPNKLDLKKGKNFQDFINSLVKEDAKILANRIFSLKEEEEYVIGMIKAVKDKTRVYLIAEQNKEIIATVSIEMERWRKNHIGKFSIAIKDGYRGLGLGSYLVSEIIKLAKNDLALKPKIIQLEAYANNKPAIGLYKKSGFKVVARIPKQIQYGKELITELVMIKEI
jgi:ribosomal protein S18 acetylase RimI-like enzyme